MLPYAIWAWVIFMLVSLKYGWLDRFFFGTMNAKVQGIHYDVQGIDYFSLPRGFLNLLEGRSIFDTWGGAPYGPRATWYLSHPAFIVFVASFFSFFSPWVSYGLFTLFTVLVMAYTAFLISQYTKDQLTRQWCFVFLLCSFPLYWVLLTGNSHAPTVLGLAFLFAGVFETLHDKRYTPASANQKLIIGLLICFFSKPVVFIMLPLLLVLPETRRATLKSLAIYAFVSLLFLWVPALNPESIGVSKVFDLLLHPDFVRQHMNIYKNNFVLNEYMKDNSIHWLNLIAQSNHYMNHIEIFSLSSFINTLFETQVPPTVFKLPLLFTVFMSFFILAIKDRQIRLQAALLLLMATSLTFFLSYSIVWEYQYTSVFPVAAFLLIQKNDHTFYQKIIPYVLSLTLLISLPSLYFLLPPYNADTLATQMLLIRSTRVVPVLLIFLIMIVAIVKQFFYSVRGNREKLGGVPLSGNRRRGYR